jgi:hypothetical protein
VRRPGELAGPEFGLWTTLPGDWGAPAGDADKPEGGRAARFLLYFEYREGRQRTVYVGATGDPKATVAKKRGHYYAWERTAEKKRTIGGDLGALAAGPHRQAPGWRPCGWIPEAKKGATVPGVEQLLHSVLHSLLEPGLDDLLHIPLVALEHYLVMHG